MSEDLSQLKREVRAELELMWGNQADSNSRIGSLSRSIESHATMIEEQGRQIAISMRQSAALGREVVSIGDQMVGRLRQLDQKFGKFIDAVDRRSDERLETVEQQSRQRLDELEKRVSRLEQKDNTAA